MARFRVTAKGNAEEAHRALRSASPETFRVGPVGPTSTGYSNSPGPRSESDAVTVQLDADTAEEARTQVAERLPEGCRIVSVEPVGAVEF